MKSIKNNNLFRTLICTIYTCVVMLSMYVKPVEVEAAPVRRANTVEFFAGYFSGTGAASSAQHADTENTFSTFNWELAEDNVDIVNAFVQVEIHYEAYSQGNGAYTGYELAFDACEEACTADAFGGTGNVNDDDNTTLNHDEAESFYVRLLIDVTNEAQIAAYTGGGTDMEAQVGYEVDTGSVVDSIASAMAKLVITYEYDGYSTNVTNTVVYPLDSTNGSDVGTRTAGVSAACTKNTNCPEFDYTVTIPEFDTRLDAWFDVGYFNDVHNNQDRTIDLNIQGDDTDSVDYVHESQLGGTQGIDRDIYWSVDNDTNWTGGASGFAENTAQQLEISFNGNQFYLIGGLVYETYTAPRIAARKTKTVKYPIGEVQAANSTTKASESVDVYFPEDGVNVEAAFFRIKSSVGATGSSDITVTTTVGGEAESGNTVYQVDPPSNLPKNAPEIIHMITAAADFTELETATATTPVTVTVSTTNENAARNGGTSAELFITYTYSGDDNGSMRSLKYFAGQQMTAPAMTYTQADDSIDPTNPERTGTKTIRGASLDASVLVSDSDGAVSGDWTLGADIDGNSDLPCASTETLSTQDDTQNQTYQFFMDVTTDFDDLDDTYTACYSSANGDADGTDAGKWNGILQYIYQWDRGPLKGAVMVVD